MSVYIPGQYRVEWYLAAFFQYLCGFGIGWTTICHVALGNVYPGVFEEAIFDG